MFVRCVIGVQCCFQIKLLVNVSCAQHMYIHAVDTFWQLLCWTYCITTCFQCMYPSNHCLILIYPCITTVCSHVESQNWFHRLDSGCYSKSDIKVLNDQITWQLVNRIYMLNVEKIWIYIYNICCIYISNITMQMALAGTKRMNNDLRAMHLHVVMISKPSSFFPIRTVMKACTPYNKVWT